MQKVEEPSIVHDILWQFNCSLASHPVQQMAARIKAEREREEKGQKNEKVATTYICQCAELWCIPIPYAG